MLLRRQEGDGAWGCLWASARCGLFLNAPGRAAAGRRVCGVGPLPAPVLKGRPACGRPEASPAPFFCPVGAGAWPFGRVARWAARLCCGGARAALCRGAGDCGPWWLFLSFSGAVPLLSPSSWVLFGLLLFRFCPFSFCSSLLRGCGVAAPALRVSGGCRPRVRPVWDLACDDGWRPGAGLGRRHGVLGGLRRARPSGGLPWMVCLFSAA